ncbi:hypothetical protein CFB3_19050 [Clostridium folliculivorans]|uniref:Uncharacterized protein n=1 Tax=Clostridium folliculivorans TaxID=2886038 RepID=A0A9W5XZC0_9CLOT|nr:hypothetical protein CFOLD11_05080 [Clostridium folliculivorans]GKU29798.1 hypothetical protein CFB3_19050 [Clostridium folliculivorans]
MNIDNGINSKITTNVYCKIIRSIESILKENMSLIRIPASPNKMAESIDVM